MLSGGPASTAESPESAAIASPPPVVTSGVVASASGCPPQCPATQGNPLGHVSVQAFPFSSRYAGTQPAYAASAEANVANTNAARLFIWRILWVGSNDRTNA